MLVAGDVAFSIVRCREVQTDRPIKLFVMLGNDRVVLLLVRLVVSIIGSDA